jgi:hypothetical protein
VLIPLLVAAVVVLVPLPALVLGVRGLGRHPGFSYDEPADRVSFALLVTLRTLLLLMVFALSAVTLVSAIGAAIKAVELHGLVYVFLVLDLLLTAVVLLTFGRRDRRPVRRRASPAAR